MKILLVHSSISVCVGKGSDFLLLIVARVERERLLVVVNGVIKVAFLPVSIAAAPIALGVIGFELDNALEILDGSVVLALSMRSRPRLSYARTNLSSARIASSSSESAPSRPPCVCAPRPD